MQEDSERISSALLRINFEWVNELTQISLQNLYSYSHLLQIREIVQHLEASAVAAAVHLIFFSLLLSQPYFLDKRPQCRYYDGWMRTSSKVEGCILPIKSVRMGFPLLKTISQTKDVVEVWFTILLISWVSKYLPLNWNRSVVTVDWWRCSETKL